jgi:hypothetical protein
VKKIEEMKMKSAGYFLSVKKIEEVRMKTAG